MKFRLEAAKSHVKQVRTWAELLETPKDYPLKVDYLH